ncbi:hypothetical protein GNI_030760 [Gregarina niphandrodes]|uniref:Uncharacterized protein n=1 Tax=Gregarina niphandrodes TaxID=110365 RepID=A0A023BB02_GRENI|nr:hypothetical protein GNI_030760 [Gregarina niphandrodes]EZG78962.1 hypothetical protein GNI_030760 [Gregarina niphandrodes]|eukprot:XP_011129155.1 hypothetical protein GNI_030760 [Gregarina niphandrodes]
MEISEREADSNRECGLECSPKFMNDTLNAVCSFMYLEGEVSVFWRALTFRSNLATTKVAVMENAVMENAVMEEAVMENAVMENAVMEDAVMVDAVMVDAVMEAVTKGSTSSMPTNLPVPTISASHRLIFLQWLTLSIQDNLLYNRKLDETHCILRHLLERGGLLTPKTILGLIKILVENYEPCQEVVDTLLLLLRSINEEDIAAQKEVLATFKRAGQSFKTILFDFLKLDTEAVKKLVTDPGTCSACCDRFILLSQLIGKSLTGPLGSETTVTLTREDIEAHCMTWSCQTLRELIQRKTHLDFVHPNASGKNVCTHNCYIQNEMYKTIESPCTEKELRSAAVFGILDQYVERAEHDNHRGSTESLIKPPEDIETALRRELDEFLTDL